MSTRKSRTSGVIRGTRVFVSWKFYKYLFETAKFLLVGFGGTKRRWNMSKMMEHCKSRGAQVTGIVQSYPSDMY